MEGLYFRSHNICWPVPISSRWKCSPLAGLVAFLCVVLHSLEIRRGESGGHHRISESRADGQIARSVTLESLGFLDGYRSGLFGTAAFAPTGRSVCKIAHPQSHFWYLNFTFLAKIFAL
jgi:hypothetical protein